MMLKTTTEKKKVTKIVTVKTTETYAEALRRVRKEVDKILSIDGLDCEWMMCHDAHTCSDCIMCNAKAPIGARCLKARVLNLIEEAQDKARHRGI